MGTVAWAVVAALVLATPLLTLLVQAAGDRWTGRSILPQAFGTRGLRRAFDDPLFGPAIRNSTSVAVATVAIALVLAWPAARALARDDRRGLQLMLLLPLLVPPLAVGEGLTPWFLRLGIADSLLAIVIAHLVTVLPYVILVLVGGFTDEVLESEHAAASLGAGPLRRLVDITIPAVRRHLGLALALGFTVSWSQYGSSLAVAGGIPMLPVVLVPFVRSDAQIAAVLDVVFLLPPLIALSIAATLRQHGDRLTIR
ncbi:MAG: ABC transporter permease [Acidimicrobiia bacterium]